MAPLTQSTWCSNNYINAFGLVNDLILYKVGKYAEYIWYMLDQHEY